MSYTSAAIIIFATGLAAATISMLVRRLVLLDALRRHHEIGSAVFLQMGVIFAVLLAFVFNETWSEYNAAAEAVSRECADLRVAALLSGNLPRDSEEITKALIMSYINAVIDDEWPDMAQRRESGRAEQRLKQLALGVTRLPMSDPQETQTRDEIALLLRSAEQHRETRLFQMRSGIPPVLWVMLLSFSAALIGFLFFFGMENVASQMGFTAVFAAALAFLLVILKMLDYPFEGAMQLSPAPFQETLEHLRQMM